MTISSAMTERPNCDIAISRFSSVSPIGLICNIPFAEIGPSEIEQDNKTKNTFGSFDITCTRIHFYFL